MNGGHRPPGNGRPRPTRPGGEAGQRPRCDTTPRGPPPAFGLFWGCEFPPCSLGLRVISDYLKLEGSEVITPISEQKGMSVPRRLQPGSQASLAPSGAGVGGGRGAQQEPARCSRPPTPAAPRVSTQTLGPFCAPSSGSTGNGATEGTPKDIADPGKPRARAACP